MVRFKVYRAKSCVQFHYPTATSGLFFILVTIGCGATSSENCTYFESSAAPDGGCVGKICKCNTDICQVSVLYYLG